jgi:hypothetical protein
MCEPSSTQCVVSELVKHSRGELKGRNAEAAEVLTRALDRAVFVDETAICLESIGHPGRVFRTCPGQPCWRASASPCGTRIPGPAFTRAAVRSRDEQVRFQVHQLAAIRSGGVLRRPPHLWELRLSCDPNAATGVFGGAAVVTVAWRAAPPPVATAHLLEAERSAGAFGDFASERRDVIEMLRKESRPRFIGIVSPQPDPDVEPDAIRAVLDGEDFAALEALRRAAPDRRDVRSTGRVRDAGRVRPGARVAKPRPQRRGLGSGTFSGQVLGCGPGCELRRCVRRASRARGGRYPMHQANTSVPLRPAFLENRWHRNCRPAPRSAGKGAVVTTTAPPAASPLSLKNDDEALRVLQAVRSLLADAERLSVAEDPLSRMSTILVAQTALETLMRCAWERVTHKSRDANMEDIENELFALLRPHGLPHRDKTKALRLCRNAVAHHGSTPAAEDVSRHAVRAREFATTLVRVAWGEDLERLTGISMIEDERIRLYLDRAYRLLHDPAYVLEGGDGQEIRLEAAARPTVAVGIARAMWERARNRMLWANLDRATKLFPQLEYGQRENEELQKNYLAREQALQTDLLALSLGIRQVDLHRFLTTEGAAVGFSGDGRMLLTVHAHAAADDARFVLDFTTDWVLRSQQHIR